MTELKTCTKCKVEKPATREFFSPRSDRPVGLYSHCKQCKASYAKAQGAIDPHYSRDRHEKKHWGVGTYAALVAQQGEQCAICAIASTGGRGRFHIDHDHDTGVVRGLLCARCNLAIGKMADDATLLFAAASYLTSPPCAVLGYMKRVAVSRTQ